MTSIGEFLRSSLIRSSFGSNSTVPRIQKERDTSARSSIGVRMRFFVLLVWSSPRVKSGKASNLPRRSSVPFHPSW